MTGQRIAVVGAAGWAGRRHIAAFQSLGARIRSVVDPSSAVRDVAQSVGAVVLDSADQLSADDIDLVVVALPSSLQPAVVASLLSRGLRVLVEKPLGTSSSNAAVLDGVARIEEALMVGYTLHHHPIARKLTDWVQASSVVSVSVRSAARKLSLDSWRTAPDEGGVAVVNGIHAIEYVASLFRGEATVVSAYSDNRLHNTPTPDYAAACVAFEGGPLFRLETYWNPWNHTSGLNGNDWSFEIDVIAYEGRRLWSNWALHKWDRHGDEVVEHHPEADLFLEQARTALEFARGGAPLVGYAQALRATELADAIRAGTATTR